MREIPKPDVPDDTGKPDAAPARAVSREERLKAALKANMGRRKAQARARSADLPDNDNKAT